MKKLSFILILLAVLSLIPGCSGAKGENMYTEITQKEAKEIMDTESDIVILDVRTEEEYAEGHIENAICIPNENIDSSVETKLPDKSQTILVYCRSGNRSKQAAKKLSELGYTDIREFGGINTWEYGTVK